MRVSGVGWVLTTASAASVVALGPGVTGLTGALGGPSFPDAMVAAASLALLAVSAWVLVVVSLTALVGWLGGTRGPSSRCLHVLAPHLLRRALFTGAAGALALSPAHAGALGTDRGAPPSAHSVSGLPLPDRPSSSPPAGALRPAGVPVGPADRSIVVRTGDTLWAIAARSLPPGAPDSDIVRACAAWHSANRAVIGDDPDRIFPTQRLTPPTGKDTP